MTLTISLKGYDSKKLLLIQKTLALNFLFIYKWTALHNMCSKVFNSLLNTLLPNVDTNISSIRNVYLSCKKKRFNMNRSSHVFKVAQSHYIFRIYTCIFKFYFQFDFSLTRYFKRLFSLIIRRLYAYGNTATKLSLKKTSALPIISYTFKNGKIVSIGA